MVDDAAQRDGRNEKPATGAGFRCEDALRCSAMRDPRWRHPPPWRCAL